MDQVLDPLKALGIPGGVIIALVYLGRMAIMAIERLWKERNAVEDKKADAMVAAVTSLANKVDTHAITDIQSHRQLGEAIAEMRGQLDAVIARGVATPARGVPAYRKGTQGDRDDR